MQFKAPQLGALGVSYTALRLLQFISLITIVGLVAFFIDEIISYQQAAPDVMIGTLSVAAIATLYVAISYILYYDGLLPLLIAGGLDFAMLIATVVVAATFGKPLGVLSCAVLPPKDDPTNTVTFTTTQQTSVPTSNYIRSTSSTYNSAVAASDAQSDRPTADYLSFVAVDQPHCYQVKTVWGLSIALCILFAFSSIVCVGLWRRIKTSQAPPKDIEG